MNAAAPRWLVAAAAAYAAAGGVAVARPAVTHAVAGRATSPLNAIPRMAATVPAAAGLVPHPGATLPLDVELTAEDGRAVTVGALLHGRPAVLTFVYAGCSNLCPLLIQDLESGLKGISAAVGRTFDVWIVSIDQGDGPRLMAQQRRRLDAAYGRTAPAASWHLLTGKAAEVARLAAAAGIYYTYEPEARQYRHPTALMTVTPRGLISRYLVGLGITSRDLRLALSEADAEHVDAPGAGLLASLLLLCFHYDPVAGRYGLAAMNLVRGGATAAASTLVWLLLRLGRRGHGRRTEDAV